MTHSTILVCADCKGEFADRKAFADHLVWPEQVVRLGEVKCGAISAGRALAMGGHGDIPSPAAASRMEALLIRLEFGSSATGIGPEAEEVWRCCPLCAGVHPGSLGKDAPASFPRGHRVGCDLGALLVELDAAKNGGDRG